jgi:hypothetical protein
LRPPFDVHVNYGGAEEKDADPHNLAKENLGRIAAGRRQRLRKAGHSRVPRDISWQPLSSLTDPNSSASLPPLPDPPDAGDGHPLQSDVAGDLADVALRRAAGARTTALRPRYAVASLAFAWAIPARWACSVASAFVDDVRAARRCKPLAHTKLALRLA